MNQHQLQQVKTAVLLTHRYYRCDIDEVTVSMYVDDLSDLPFDEILSAYKRYRQIPENRHPPLPSQIRALILPVESESPQMKGIVGSAKILQAIAKFGSHQGSSAKVFLGEILWQCVEMQGGWQRLCSTVNEENFTIFQAQLRDLVSNVSRRGASPGPEFYRINVDEIRQLADMATKSIDENKN